MSYILFAAYGCREAQDAAVILTGEGHTVVITNDGKEALEVVSQDLAQDRELPAVIFAHLMLPNCDGMELAYIFRRTYPQAKTKILIGTVPSSNEFACRDWEWPVSGYVMRPYSAAQLVLSVEQLLYRDVPSTNQK